MHPNAIGYSFSLNYFSDLGLWTSISGSPSYLAPSLFIAATTAAGLAQILFHVQIIKQSEQGRAPVSRLLGFSSGYGLIMLGLLPYDILKVPHFLAVSIWLLALDYLVCKYCIHFKKQGDNISLSLSLPIIALSAIYIAAYFVGDNVTVPVPAIQKALVYYIIAWFCIIPFTQRGKGSSLPDSR